MKRFGRWSLLFTFVFLVAFASIPAFTTAKTVTKTDTVLLNEIQKLSKKAQTINSKPFQVGSNLDDVIAAWGTPEDFGTVAANYWTRNIRFLYDSEAANKIFSIEDFDPRYQSITYNDVVNKFGTPLTEKEQEGNYYVTYTATQNHMITFVFYSRFTNDNPNLEQYHISVNQ